MRRDNEREVNVNSGRRRKGDTSHTASLMAAVAAARAAYFWALDGAQIYTDGRLGKQAPYSARRPQRGEELLLGGPEWVGRLDRPA
uniref:Uncharacterized protein n=1 Tax=Plectus sambesii TaxID=2011161 RepID=A0A914VSB8_9BILA